MIQNPGIGSKSQLAIDNGCLIRPESFCGGRKSLRQPVALAPQRQFVCAGISVTIGETIQPGRSIRQKPESFSGSLTDDLGDGNRRVEQVVVRAVFLLVVDLASAARQQGNAGYDSNGPTFGWCIAVIGEMAFAVWGKTD